MFKSLATGVAFVSLAALANATVNDTIDFESLSAGTDVSTQFSEAEFSSESGLFVTAYSLGVQGQPPTMGICPRNSDGQPVGMRELYVDFTVPVNSLSFQGLVLDGTGTVAQVRVYENGTLSATVNVTGLGNPYIKVPVDLTAYTEVTRIEIFNITDLHGACWDDFSFAPCCQATWSTYGTGHPGTGSQIPTLTLSSNPSLGTTTSLNVSNTSGVNTFGLLIMGAASDNIPTSLGGNILVGVPLFWGMLELPSFGLILPIPIPNEPSLSEADAFLQVLMGDSGASNGVAFTGGLQMTLGS